MHGQDPVQDLKTSQPPSTRNKRSPRQRTALLLAIVIVNSTPPGTSVLGKNAFLFATFACSRWYFGGIHFEKHSIGFFDHLYWDNTSLDRLGQIIQDREQQKQQQQEQQRCTDATKSQQVTTFPQQDEDEEGKKKDGSAGRRDDFSPDRTRSPSPRLVEKRQQQQQRTQQLDFGGSTVGGRDQAWKLHEKLLETGKKT